MYFESRIFLLLGVVIGLEQTAYSVVESIGLVEVCAILRQGSLAREVLVTLSTGDRSAVCKYSTVFLLYNIMLVDCVHTAVATTFYSSGRL